MRSRDIPLAILALQAATLVTIFFNIAFARQLLGFLFVTFIPGYLILRIAKLDSLHFSTFILLSVGVSIAFLMFLGLSLNTLLPILGLQNPLSFLSILVPFNLFVVVLCAVLWVRFQSSPSWHMPPLRPLPVVVLLLSIPFLTVTGVEMARSGNPLILLLLVILVSLVVLCSFSTKLIPEEIYPLAILVIAFFLLFHLSLISNYVIGTDVHAETYFARLTFANSFWDKTIFHPYNAMISVTILPAVYANFLNLDITWIFKIVYPLIYSLAPLILYLAFRKQTSSHVAFLAVFFFMSMDTFFNQMLGLERQMIGELFFALLVLLITDEKLGMIKKRAIFIVLSVALLLSHYSLAYLFIFLALGVFSVSSYFESNKTQKNKRVLATQATPKNANLRGLSEDVKTLHGEIHKIKQAILNALNEAFGAPRLITGKFILGYMMLTSLWYIFIVPAASKNLADALGYIYNALISHISGPGVSGLTPVASSLAHRVHAYVFYLVQLFVIVGLIKLLTKRRRSQFSSEYAGMSVGSMLLLLMSIFLPSFAASLNMSRIYHISLFYLAPFCIIGGLSIFELLTNLKPRTSFSRGKLGKAAGNRIRKTWAFATALILVCLFLFQVGFVYEIVRDDPVSISLNRNRARWSTYMSYLDVDPREAYAAGWLSQYARNDLVAYADELSSHILNSYGLISPQRQGILSPGIQYTVAKNSYFFFGSLAVEKGIVVGYSVYWNSTDFSSIIDTTDRVYSNGGCDIYWGCFP